MPFKEISFKDIIFDRKVQTYCINPNFKCPNYGHSWACPPEAPYMENTVSEYEKYFLIYYKFELEPHIKKIQEKFPNRKREKIINSLYRTGLVRDLLEKEILEFLDNNQEGYKEILTLWDGFCRVCYNPNDKSCTYDSGNACRYPDKIRYSIEAVGINVDETVKNAGFNLEWPPQEFVYRFGLICFK